MNNKQLFFLGLGSTLLFGIGYYNRSFHQDPTIVFPKIEKAYQSAHSKSEPVNIVLVHDPKSKDINLFYDKEHLGYGEKTDHLVYLKPLAPYLQKLSDRQVSKMNFYIQSHDIKFFLQKDSSPKVFTYQTTFSSHLSLINIIKGILERIQFS